MLMMNRCPSRPSRSARRNADMWTVRLEGSTKRLGQTRAVKSRLLTSSPRRSSKAIRISKARLPRGTGFSSSNRRNCVGSRQNGPNDTLVGGTSAGSVLEECVVHIVTLNGVLYVKSQFGMCQASDKCAHYNLACLVQAVFRQER